MKDNVEANFRAFLEALRERSDLEKVVEETGPEYRLTRRFGGREVQGETHDSLKVNAEKGVYQWFSRNEGGDVFAWVMARHGCDFMGAVEWLARRAHMDMPTFREEMGPVARAAREREEIWGLCLGLMQRWLREDDQAWAYVLDGPYAHGEPRHFCVETVEAAGLGFTGRGEDARNAMRAVLGKAGVDVECPAAVAVLGFQGDVSRWAAKWGIEPNENWLGKEGRPGYISGLLGARRLVYPLMWHGRCVGFTARNILGSEIDRDGKPRKSYEMPVALAGEKRVYHNWLFGQGSEQVVVVEGPGDAVALGQMGLPAVALLGLGVEKNADTLAALRFYRGAGGEKCERTIYLGMDADEAGQAAIRGKDESWPFVNVFGVNARIINWQGDDGNRYYLGSSGEAHEVKDANDYLAALTQAYRGNGEWTAEVRDQVRGQAQTVVDSAELMALAIARRAGNKRGVKREQALQFAVSVMLKMGDTFEIYRKDLAQALRMDLREMQNLIKAAQAADKKAVSPVETVYTHGGYVDGWLLEYLYDAENGEARLAWRDPDGLIASGDEVNIEGRTYKPYPPDKPMRERAIFLPSELGEKKSIAELVSYIEFFLRKNYLMPSDRLTRLVSYWVLGTWLYDCFSTTIYLRAMGGAGSGKSEFLGRVALLCYRTTRINGAGSDSSFFRLVERYKGVVFIDEADIDQSDTESDMVKFYNLGAMRGNLIWRSAEGIGPNGERTFDPVGFQTFCPKLVGMRKDFKDDAVGTRALTIKLTPRVMDELMAAGVPLSITKAMETQAQKLRNLLIRWRLESWEPEIEVDASVYDLTISPRLNQVAGPLLAIARDDPAQQDDIRGVLREYYAESTITLSMTLTARILEALWKIWNYPDLHQQMVKVDEHGDALIKVGDITRITNEVMNEMNDDDNDDDDDKSKAARHEVKSRRVGSIIREELQLQVSERRRDGFWVYWNEPRLVGLSTKYGVKPDQFGPDGAANASRQPQPVVKKAEPRQDSLV